MEGEWKGILIDVEGLFRCHMSRVLIRWMKVCEEFTMGAPHKKTLFRYLGKEDRYCCGGEMKK